MVIFDAYYKFKVITDSIKGQKIIPVSKMGNDRLFNLIFEKHKFLTFTNKPAVSDIEDYSCCMINYPHGLVSYLPVFFQSWTLNNKYGIIRHAELVDAKLFKLCEDNIFEVYILKDEKANLLNLLQLMHAGELDISMQEIRLKLEQTLLRFKA